MVMAPSGSGCPRLGLAGFDPALAGLCLVSMVTVSRCSRFAICVEDPSSCSHYFVTDGAAIDRYKFIVWAKTRFIKKCDLAIAHPNMVTYIHLRKLSK